MNSFQKLYPGLLGAVSVTCCRLLFSSWPSALPYPDCATGALRGPLQSHNPLGPPDLLQLRAQAALQEHLLLLPTPHLQAESREAALHRRQPHHCHLQIHPGLQLRGVQLSSAALPPTISGETSEVPRVKWSFWRVRAQLRMFDPHGAFMSKPLWHAPFSQSVSCTQSLCPAQMAGQDQTVFSEGSIEFFTSLSNSQHMKKLDSFHTFSCHENKTNNPSFVGCNAITETKPDWMRARTITWARTCGAPTGRHLCFASSAHNVLRTLPQAFMQPR